MFEDIIGKKEEIKLLDYRIDSIKDALGMDVYNNFCSYSDKKIKEYEDKNNCTVAEGSKQMWNIVDECFREYVKKYNVLDKLVEIKRGGAPTA